MKAFSHRTLAAVLASSALAATAFAGDKYSQEVYFSPAAPIASGDLGTVRNTADTVQFIGCTVTGTVGVCFARNSAGVIHGCSTTDAGMINAMRAINGDSWMSFSWNPDGSCKDVMARNDSRDTPK